MHESPTQLIWSLSRPNLKINELTTYNGYCWLFRVADLSISMFWIPTKKKSMKIMTLKPFVKAKLVSVGFIIASSFPSWGRLLIWALQLDKALFMMFINRINSLWKHNGVTFTVLYTKECLRIVKHYISGNPLLVSNEYIVAISGGLPSIIPGTLRSSIRNNDHQVIRGVLSLLSVYRVLKIPGKLKLESITGPFTGSSMTLSKDEVKKALKSLLPISYKTSKRLRIKGLCYLSTAGPNHKTSMIGIWKDLKCWESHELRPLLESFILMHRGGASILEMLTNDWDLLKDKTFEGPLYLGRLSLKEEAAGKIRVFAISDFLTKTVMKPLSNYLFSIIRTFPTDGTFDHNSPIKRLVTLSKEGKSDGVTYYSYDLSSAIDRLPMGLQEQILSLLFNDKFSSLWASLLTKRDWYLRYSKVFCRSTEGCIKFMGNVIIDSPRDSSYCSKSGI